MNSLFRLLMIAMTTSILLGITPTTASAHHDDAKGSHIVYEGAGGR